MGPVVVVVGGTQHRRDPQILCHRPGQSMRRCSCYRVLPADDADAADEAGAAAVQWMDGDMAPHSRHSISATQ